jgi:syntaxin 5
MPPTSIQDRTAEFRAILTDVNKRQLNNKARVQRQQFTQQDGGLQGGIRQRSAFAQQTSVIAKGIVSDRPVFEE